MKRTSNILATVFILASLYGCGNKQLELPLTGDDDTSSRLPIEFGVDIAGSRAPIVEGGPGATLERLGVIGYQYANQSGSNWNTAKETARPNVFNYHPQVLKLSDSYYDTIDNANPSNVVEYSWSGNKYAFFAFYPHDHSKVTLSEESVSGTPYVTYTVDKSDVSNMADIMTDVRKELTASSRYVTFHMIHRLSAIDVEVCNIYEHVWTEEGVTYSENVDIEITDLKLTFTDLKYESSKIYLDDSEGHEPKEASVKTATYHLVEKDIDAPVSIPFQDDDEDPNTQLTADNEMTMFFIPQEYDLDKNDDLKVSVEIEFRKRRHDSTPDNPTDDYLINQNIDYTFDNEGNVTETVNAKGYGTEFFYATKNTSFEQSMDEGHRYYVLLNFTSAAVSISIVAAARWDDIEIDHEFE